MSTRISSLVLFLLLAGCDDASTNTQVLARAEANQSVEAADDGRVQCALDGAGAFAAGLHAGSRGDSERTRVDDPPSRWGFRRLRVTRDGRGVVAADGAEPAVVTIVGADEIEVSLGGDHYRLPATVRAGARGAR